jgi:hypothetical protein
VILGDCMEMMLKGSGHFAIGFTLGFFIVLVLLKIYKTNLTVQLYVPFLPFILGFWAVIPMVFFSDGLERSVWLNIFILFDFASDNSLFKLLFGRLHLVAISCGGMYGYLLLRYIALVKYCRRYGWSGEYL